MEPWAATTIAARRADGSAYAADWYSPNSRPSGAAPAPGMKKKNLKTLNSGFHASGLPTRTGHDMVQGLQGAVPATA